MDWSSALGVVEKLAPMIATGVGGPLAGGAMAALESVFNLTPAADVTADTRQSQLAAAISGATPDQLLAMTQANQNYQLQMATVGFKDKEALAALAQQQTLAYVSDTQDARKYTSNKVFWLGIAVLTTFAVVMVMALVGCYEVLTGGITIKDVAVVAAVAGLIGSVVGYVAANAQQVIGYFFGSSAGSESKTTAMADSLKNAISAQK
ncbi:hypothetical protein LT85_1040 [Collimonas arenae]|uniref:TMhelix containing protein n=1 Tax=Collimonas arenae TaxID=279058 RepID=A0A0A1F673_9BURK|nr:hypothetical protein [Collimonas arenae]AIY40198.1 hypothetical protein LT85_1040 [Collimonas arenae]